MKKKLKFMIHEHHATNLHYDFRIELDGKLVSWAVPKNLSDEKGVKRLGIRVPDHSLEYGNFEGTIPKGNYGAGKVKIWDEGTYSMEEKGTDEKAIRAGLEKGSMILVFDGKKIKGAYKFIKMKNQKADNWLIFKLD